LIRHLFAFLLVLASSGAGAAGDELAAPYFIAVRLQLDPRAQAAFQHMDGLGRQLLAARAYLRAGSALDQRWSWTQERIDNYPGSAEQVALDAEISRVRAAFEKGNPGYTLFVNPQVRSLDLQIQRWNENASIRAASERMTAELETALRAPGFPPADTVAGTARFRALLINHMPQPVPTLAAPGLSAHGRMSAVDFQVQRGNIIVAGADSTQVQSVWIAEGWREKLRAAVNAASVHFRGPLASPVEPWHYNYEPAHDDPPD
jgi:hypothetical protein